MIAAREKLKAWRSNYIECAGFDEETVDAWENEREWGTRKPVKIETKHLHTNQFYFRLSLNSAFNFSQMCSAITHSCIYTVVVMAIKCRQKKIPTGISKANHRSYQAIGNNIRTTSCIFTQSATIYHKQIVSNRKCKMAHSIGKYISLKYSNFSSFVYFSFGLSLHRKWIDHQYNWMSCENVRSSA